MKSMSKGSTKMPTKVTSNTKTVKTSGTSPNSALSAKSTVKISKKVANRTSLYNRIKNVPIFKG